MRTNLYVLVMLLIGASFHVEGRSDSTQIIRKTVTYKSTDEGELQLDIFYPPAHDVRTEKKPVIIFFHGGAWIGGKRQQFYWQCDYFAERGLVAVTASYRFMKRKGEGYRATKEICIRDAKSAIRWVKEHARDLGIDTNLVILGGGSAGGHLATIAALDVEINDPDDDTTISTKAYALVLFNPAYQLSEQTFQPFPLISRQAPPTILFFGDQDKKWKPGGDAFYDALRSEDVNAEMWVAPAQSHGFFNDGGWNRSTCSKAESFLVSLGIPFNATLIPGP